MNTRTCLIRTALGLSQAQLAARIRVNQSTIDRLEGGQRESGPLSFALDVLAAEIGRPDLTLAEFGKAVAAPDIPHPPRNAGHLLPAGEKGEAVAAEAAQAAE